MICGCVVVGVCRVFMEVSGVEAGDWGSVVTGVSWVGNWGSVDTGVSWVPLQSLIVCVELALIIGISLSSLRSFWGR